MTNLLPRPVGERSPSRILLLAILAAMLVAVACSVEEEPRYENMPVSYYIKNITQSENDRRIGEAIDALIAIGDPSVPYVIKAWREYDDADVRCRLASVIEAVGPDAQEAVPMLIDALDEIDEQEVSCAAFALGGIGAAAKPAADKLGALLRSSDTGTQVNLLYALGGIGPPAEAQIPLVKEAIQREGTRKAAIEALSLMGEPAIRSLDSWLESGNESERLAAFEVLASMSKGAPLVLDYLRKGLKDPNPRIRIYAAKALGNYGSDALPAHQALVYALRDENDDVRGTVISSLIRIGPSGSKDLISALNGRSWRSREGAARVIGRFQSLIVEAREPLIRRMDDNNVNVRIAVTDALSVLGDSVVEDMINQLRSSSVLRRWSACRVLANIGSDASEAIPELQRLLQDSDTVVRNEARKAISSIANL